MQVRIRPGERNMISEEVHADKVRPGLLAHGSGSGSVGPMVRLETGTPRL